MPGCDSAASRLGVAPETGLPARDRRPAGRRRSSARPGGSRCRRGPARPRECHSRSTARRARNDRRRSARSGRRSSWAAQYGAHDRLRDRGVPAVPCRRRRARRAPRPRSSGALAGANEMNHAWVRSAPRDVLRRTGLAGDRDAGDLRGAAGAAGLVDDPLHHRGQLARRPTPLIARRSGRAAGAACSTDASGALVSCDEVRLHERRRGWRSRTRPSPSASASPRRCTDRSPSQRAAPGSVGLHVTARRRPAAGPTGCCRSRTPWPGRRSRGRRA